MNCQPSVSGGAAEMTVAAPKDISLQVNNGLHVARSDKAVRVKLKQKVQDCKAVFHEQSFTISSDGHLETVNLNEIDGFFSRFEEGVWLSMSGSCRASHADMVTKGH